MPTGTVKSYDAERGFGLITPDEDGPDVFVYFAAVASPADLEVGQQVTFDVIQGPKGPQAETVIVV